MKRLVLAFSGLATVIAIACSVGEVETHTTESSDKDSTVVEYVSEEQNFDLQAVRRSDTEDGGVLLIDNLCTSADPAIDGSASIRGIGMFPLVSEIHAGLMSVAEDGKVRAELELAERFTVRENGAVYEFVLKRGLKFSDGSPLTAMDVKWSWERALRKSTGFSRANDVLGSIVGARNVVTGEREDLAGVEAVDERTLVVRLRYPRYDLPILLTDPIASVLKRDNVELWGYEWENVDDPLAALGGNVQPNAFGGAAVPVGAGPFRLSQYSPLSIHGPCVLERNDHYWGEPARLNGVVFVDDIFPQDPEIDVDLKAIEERAFADHRLDFFVAPPDFAESVREGESSILGRVVYQDDLPYTQFVALNPAFPPFDDVHFRRAVVAASNLEHVFDPFPVKWEQRLMPPQVSSQSSNVTAIEFDPELAKEELGKSKYSDSVDRYQPVFFSDSEGYFDERLARLFESWRDVLGFEVLHDHGSSVFISNLARQENLAIREIELSPQYPSPHAVLREFISAFGRTDESLELTKVRQMISSALSEQDDSARSMLYGEIERYILEQALAIPLLTNWLTYEIVVQPWVQGLKFPIYPSSAFKGVWFDGTAPDRVLPYGD